MAEVMRTFTIDGITYDVGLFDDANGTPISAQYSGATVNSPYVAGWDNYKMTAMAKAVNATAANDKSDANIATTAFVQNAINRRLPQTRNVDVSDWNVQTIAHSTLKSWVPYYAPANGTFIGVGFVRFAQNVNGYRFADCLGSATGLRVAAPSNGVSQLSFPIVLELNAGNGIEIRYSQASGGNLNVTGRSCVGVFIFD